MFQGILGPCVEYGEQPEDAIPVRVAHGLTKREAGWEAHMQCLHRHRFQVIFLIIRCPFGFGVWRTVSSSAPLLHRAIPTMAPSVQRALLLELSLQAVVHADRIEARINHAALGRRLGIETPNSDCNAIELDIPILVARRGTDVKLVIRFDASALSSRRDPKLVELIVKAHQAKRQLGLDGKPPSAPADPGYRERNHLVRLARLSFLAPDIVRAILEGTQPASLLYRMADLPADTGAIKG